MGVALGSGGSKGLSHISVLEFLKAEGIRVDMIAGSSIGSVIGALYSIGAMESFRDEILSMDWREYIKLVDPVFPRTGLVKGEKIRDYLARFIPEKTKIEDLPIPLSIVATDFYTGKPVVFRSGNVLDAIRASISIPGVFTPVRWGESILIDGGVSNPLPVDVVKRMGAGLTVAVNLHPSLPRKRLSRATREKMEQVHEADANKITYSHGTDSSSSEQKTWMWQLTAFFEKRRIKPHPEKNEINIFTVIAQSIDILEYMNTQMILHAYKPDVTIEPDLIGMPTLDFTNAARALAEGREACRRVRGQIIRKIKFWL
ncbi:MAG: patatin-like phospholipase family protein [Spirochaetes bacterium]|nr:patatin-like phospholipase family protein [Spirochaetota bacterium]